MNPRMRGALVASVLIHVGLVLGPRPSTDAEPGGGAGGERAGGAAFEVTLAPPAMAAAPELVPAAVEAEPAPDGLLDPEPVPAPRLATLIEVDPFEETGSEPLDVAEWFEAPTEPTPSPLAPASRFAGEGEVAGEGEGSEGVGLGKGDGEGDSGDSAPPARFRPPRLQRAALPLTPEEAKGLPSPLAIEVRLHVDRNGRVIEVKPLQTDLPEVLLAALLKSAASMRFRPAMMGDERVDAWYRMEFNY